MRSSLAQFPKHERLSAFAGHVSAALLSLCASLILGRLAAEGGLEPSLILLALPITLSAMLGGLGVGLTATIATAFGAALWVLPPSWSARIDSGGDLLGWGALVGNGVLVSLMAGALMRSRRREVERRRALEAEHGDLLREQQWLGLALDAAEAGVWSVVPSTGAFKASDRALAIHGLPPGTSMDHERALAEVYPDDRPKVEAALKHTLETGEPFHLELRIPQPDGSLRWIASCAELHADPAPARIVGLVRDISVQKEAERRLSEARLALERHQEHLEHLVIERTAELAASEAKFRALVEQSLAGIAVQEQGRFVYVNRALAAMHGLDDPGEMVGRACAAFVVAEDRQWVGELAETMLETQMIVRGLRPDGSAVNLEVHARPARLDDRDVSVCITLDVTERLRTEAALRNSEARQRLAIAAANIGLWDWDMLAKRVAYSREYKAQLGYAEDDIGNDFSEWERRLHPDDRGLALERLDRLLESDRTKDFETEFRMLHKDGTWRWIYARAEVLRDETGRPIRMLGCHLDITERKRIEEAMRISEERLRLAQGSAQVGIWDWHPQSGEVFWTPELERVYGYEEGAFPGTYAAFTERVHPHDLQRVERLRNEAVSADRPFDFDFRVRTLSGDIRWVQCKGGAIYDEAGRPRRIFGVNLDITERKQMEQALETAAQQQALLSRRLLAIQETERGQLARELHDEIGQVLTAVHLNLQAVQVALQPGALHARLQDCLDVTNHAIQQVRARSLELRPALLDDVGLIPAIEQLIARQTERAECAIDLQAQPLTRRLSPEREIACYRVIQEAITNALRHAGARRVRVRLTAVDSRLQLEVADDGCGFDPEVVRRAALNGKRFGLLGIEERLTLVGGGIEIRSRPGQGCEVRAWLPLECEEQ